MNDSDHFHTENGCLYCIVGELYGKLRQLNEDKMQLAVENIAFKRRIEEMDKQIAKLKSKGKSLVRDTEKLRKADIKRDPYCDAGEKAMKAKKKKK